MTLSTAGMGVVGDVRLQRPVEFFRKDDVTDVVLPHLSAGTFVTVNDLDPEIEAFVLYLLTDTKHRAYESELTGLEPELSHCLQKVDTGRRRRRRELGEEEFSTELTEIERVRVISDDSVGFGQELMGGFEHCLSTVFPLAVEVDFFLSDELSREANDRGRLNDLWQGDVLIEQPPDVDGRRSCLDV